MQVYVEVTESNDEGELFFFSSIHEYWQVPESPGSWFLKKYPECRVSRDENGCVYLWKDGNPIGRPSMHSGYDARLRLLRGVPSDRFKWQELSVEEL